MIATDAAGAASPVRLGGELRIRIESLDRPDFGLSDPGYTSVMTRGLVQAEVALGDAARVYLQASIAQESGRPDGPRAFDESRADLAQGYVELPVGDATVRIGRQELVSAGNRLLGMRDAAPLRRAFDGIRGEVRLGRAVGTAFALRPVLNRPGALDDRPDANDLFAGATLDVPSGSDGTLGVFLFRRHLARAPNAPDTRATLGARYRRDGSRWDLSSQLAVQRGNVGRIPVQAWSGSIEIGRKLHDPSTRVAVQLGAASGDRSDDGRIGTFDSLYPNLGAYSEAPIYYPANQINLGVRAEGLWHGWNVAASAVALARMYKDDTIYSASGRPLVSDQDGSHVHGGIAELRAILPIGSHTQFVASLVHSEPSGSLERAGGQAATFGYVQLSRRF